MRKKFLFAVMALLTMATGKIWAQKAYALLCNETDDGTYSMHFVYTSENTSETINTDGTGGDFIDSNTTLTYTKAWEITEETPGWNYSTDNTHLSDNEKQKITQVVFEKSFETATPTTCTSWFNGFNKLNTIVGLENLITTSVVDMSYMFSGCNNLMSLTFGENFNTSNVKNMNGMFNGCKKLEKIDLSNFNTEKVEDMNFMFNTCSDLTSITFGSNFNTLNVTDMSSMFNGCSSLTLLDLSKFDTSKVKYMNNMFFSCSSLTSIDLSSFNTSEVTNMSSMFDHCIGLTSLNLSNFNTSKVTDMIGMFVGCSSLTSLDLSSFNTSKVTDMSYMFAYCSSLKEIDLSSFDTSNVEDDKMNNMFNGRPTDKKIAIGGNALVFVADDQKKTWDDNTTGAKFVVKNENDGSTYDGDIEINSDNINQTLNIPYEFMANKVTFTRTFEKNKPYTICLPFAVTNTADYGIFYKFSGYDKDNGKVTFTNVEKTEPNTPYLFIPTDKVETITVGTESDNNSVTISSTSSMEYADDCFIGVYEKKEFTQEDIDGDYNYYGWTSSVDENGGFRKAGKGASVPACRAYIRLPKSESGSANAPARLSVQFGDGDTTGINAVESGADGGADAPVYNLQGQRVGSSYKGVVIKNGKKVIIK